MGNASDADMSQTRQTQAELKELRKRIRALRSELKTDFGVRLPEKSINCLATLLFRYQLLGKITRTDPQQINPLEREKRLIDRLVKFYAKTLAEYEDKGLADDDEHVREHFRQADETTDTLAGAASYVSARCASGSPGGPR